MSLRECQFALYLAVSADVLFVLALKEFLFLVILLVLKTDNDIFQPLDGLEAILENMLEDKIAAEPQVEMEDEVDGDYEPQIYFREAMNLQLKPWNF